MTKTAAMTVLLALMATSGCNSSQVSLIPPISDGKKTFQQFISSKSFPYSIQENRKKQIIDNYQKLEIGMTKQEVNTFIGEPDFSKYMHSKDSPSKYLGSKWTYYFYKPAANIVNEKLDRGLLIYYGTDDKTNWIVPRNIEGLTEKGGPSRNDS
jgi:outer membrane protein assembly factor BamE (lipoprotein component of BamABCDE complex)